MATAPPGCPGVRFIFWLEQNQNWVPGLLRVATKTRPSRVIYPEVGQLCKESKRWGCECQVWQRKEEDKSWCEKAGLGARWGAETGQQEAQAWSCEHCKKARRQGCFCRVWVPQCRARPLERHPVQIPASLVSFPTPLCVQPAPGLSTPCSLLLPHLSLWVPWPLVCLLSWSQLCEVFPDPSLPITPAQLRGLPALCPHSTIHRPHYSSYHIAVIIINACLPC